MRAIVLLVALAACRDHTTPAPPPAPAPKPAPKPTPVFLDEGKPLPPRGEHVVDEQGYGRLWIGEPTSQIDHLVEPPNPHGYLERTGSIPSVELTIDARRAQETVMEAAISDPAAVTRDGVRIGITFDELDKRYGPPSDHTGGCRQYAKAPGIAFCGGYQTLERFEIPAHRHPPLNLGEDLEADRAAFETHALRMNDPTLVAPCLLVGELAHPAIALGGAVYDTEGGWRRPDGSMLICTDSTAITDASVFEIDASGHGTRWMFSRGHYFRREPATCTIAPPHITCDGTSGRAENFEGTFVDAFGSTFILATRWIHRDNPKQDLAELRRMRRDGTPTDACERQLTDAWANSVAARNALGMPTDDAARLDYLDDGYSHMFIGECHVPRSKQFPPEPPRIRHRSQPERAPYTAVERRKRERELVGSWHSVGPYGQLSDWTFTASGQQLDRIYKDDYSVPRPGVLMVGQRPYQFARIDADHFVVSDPGFRSGIRCPEDLHHAEIEELDGWLLIDEPACSMITRTDRLPSTTCKPGPANTLGIEYTGDDAKPAHFTLSIADGCYIADVGVWTYTRVR